MGLDVWLGEEVKAMLFTLYLIGYGNETPEPFLERLEMAGEQVMVVDVRSRRRSWAWSYSGPQVEMLFKKAGHDYIWLPGLGGNGQVEDIAYLFDMQAAEVQIRNGRLPVVLMCAERLSTDCHRAELARQLQERFESAGDQLEIRPL
jgi:uncharacterized protein (DUF488 family)